MKVSNHIKRVVIECICLLYALLFIYASVSKIMDFERFRVQLSQSPILSAFAAWISWAVIGIELLIAALILYNKTRTIALFAALSLMSMFTAYIFIILHFSSFVPCSCGGILEKMNWKVHFIFNLVFLLLALIALILKTERYQNAMMKKKLKLYFGYMFFSILTSIMFVSFLFLSSEKIIHQKNPFVRRYVQNSINQIQTVELKFNSYYFAGAQQGMIYLGNYTDPLHLLAIDLLGRKKNIQLDFDHKELPFQAIRIVIRGNFVYLMDGTIPCVFRGDIKDWRINKELKGMPGFTLAEPIDSAAIAFRNNMGQDRANILGIFYAGQTPKVRYAKELIQSQIDGVFDTDGLLRYNEEMKLVLYSYFYRNQFVLADRNGKLKLQGHTIDTITHAKIKVAYLRGKTERQMGAPPFMVNALTATTNHLLFVYSKVQGRYDDDNVWKQCSMIDVYDLKKNTYLLSFPVYGNENKKIQHLLVTTTHLYAIIGTDLIIYQISGLLEKEMTKH